MVIDNNYILFGAALSEIATNSYNAGIGHKESELFIKRIYDEYLLTSNPAPDITWIKSIPTDVKKWMVYTLNKEFFFMTERPKWVREPSWRFIEDNPMIFISQVEFENNKTMAEHLSSGDVIYMFSGKKEVDGGWELVIKMVIQNKNSVGTSYMN
ncbi:TPA: hypothetical protein ACSEEH_005262 [Escherichia coli]